MICYKCGHHNEYHIEDFCGLCWKHRANYSRFFEHEFMGNLEYLETKSLEKQNVA
jgi:hypothetical protein